MGESGGFAMTMTLKALSHQQQTRDCRVRAVRVTAKGRGGKRTLTAFTSPFSLEVHTGNDLARLKQTASRVSVAVWHFFFHVHKMMFDPRGTKKVQPNFSPSFLSNFIAGQLASRLARYYGRRSSQEGFDILP